MSCTSPDAKLDDIREGMIVLARQGAPFIQYAAREIVRGISSHLSWELMYNMVLSALAREDERAVRIYVNDWSATACKKPQRSIFKWIPGDHFYALEDKFDTLDEAKQHLKRHGYECGPVVEQHVYAQGGD